MKNYITLTLITILSNIIQAQTWRPSYPLPPIQPTPPPCANRILMLTVLTPEGRDTRYSGNDTFVNKDWMLRSANCAEVLTTQSFLNVAPGQTISRVIAFRNPTIYNVMIDFLGGYQAENGRPITPQQIGCASALLLSYKLVPDASNPSSVREIYSNNQGRYYRVSVPAGQTIIAHFSFTAPTCDTSYIAPDQHGQRAIRFVYSYWPYYNMTQFNRERAQHFEPLPRIVLSDQVHRISHINCGRRSIATFSLGSGSDVFEYRLSETSTFAGPWMRLMQGIDMKEVNISAFAINQDVWIQYRHLLPNGQYSSPTSALLCPSGQIPQAFIEVQQNGCLLNANRIALRVAPFNHQLDFMGFPVNPLHTRLEVQWRYPQGAPVTATLDRVLSGQGPFTVNVINLPSDASTRGIILQARWIANGVAGAWSPAVSCTTQISNVQIQWISFPFCNRSEKFARFFMQLANTPPLGSQLVVEYSTQDQAWRRAQILSETISSSQDITIALPSELTSIQSLFVRAYWQNSQGQTISNIAGPLLLCEQLTDTVCFSQPLSAAYNHQTKVINITVPRCPSATFFDYAVATDSEFREIIIQSTLNVRLTDPWNIGIPATLANHTTYHVRVRAAGRTITTSFRTGQVTSDPPSSAFVPTPQISFNCAEGSLTYSFSTNVVGRHRLQIYTRTGGIAPMTLRNTIEFDSMSANSVRTFRLNLNRNEQSDIFQIQTVAVRVSDNRQSQTSNSITCNNNWLSRATPQISILNVNCGPVNRAASRTLTYSVRYIGTPPTRGIWRAEYRSSVNPNWVSLPDVSFTSENYITVLSNIRQFLPTAETFTGNVSIRGRVLNAERLSEATLYTPEVTTCDSNQISVSPRLLSLNCDLVNGVAYLSVDTQTVRDLPLGTVFNLEVSYGNSNEWSPIYSGISPPFMLYLNSLHARAGTSVRAYYSAPGTRGPLSNVVSCSLPSLTNPAITINGTAQQFCDQRSFLLLGPYTIPAGATLLIQSAFDHRQNGSNTVQQNFISWHDCYTIQLSVGMELGANQSETFTINPNACQPGIDYTGIGQTSNQLRAIRVKVVHGSQVVTSNVIYCLR